MSPRQSTRQVEPEVQINTTYATIIKYAKIIGFILFGLFSGMYSDRFGFITDNDVGYKNYDIHMIDDRVRQLDSIVMLHDKKIALIEQNNVIITDLLKTHIYESRENDNIVRADIKKLLERSFK